MIQLELVWPDEDPGPIAAVLAEHPGVSRVRGVAMAFGGSIVTASVEGAAVDPLLELLDRSGVPTSSISLARVEEIGLTRPNRDVERMIWSDIQSQASTHARPVAFYLAYMIAAGVIACYGILDKSGILIVGAMAISPDLLPITAIAVAAIAGRGRLLRRALLTVAMGMATVAATAAVLTLAQNLLGGLHGFNPDETILGSLTHVNDETVAVALAAGIAGMLALETRASAAVGVAISVTTVPAAAYLGVSLGLGNSGDSAGALAVLGTNILMMVVGATGALLVQGALRDRRPAKVPAVDRGGPDPST